MVAKYEYDDWGNVLTVTDANNKSITDKKHIANLNYILLEFKFWWPKGSKNDKYRQ